VSTVADYDPANIATTRGRMKMNGRRLRTRGDLNTCNDDDKRKCSKSGRETKKWMTRWYVRSKVAGQFGW
jgi:hypothetical protein